MAEQQKLVKVPSEEIYTNIHDRFIYNIVIKTGYGLALGGLFSLTIFKRRTWPVFLGSGVGIGFALSDYNKELKSINKKLI